MKLRKGIALIAALVGFGAVTVDAAEITSVTVTSPDSGVVRGIDSTFVIKATVSDFSLNDDDGILLYLYSGSDSSGVLTGPTSTPTLNDSNAVNARSAGSILASVFGGTPSSGTNLVAVGVSVSSVSTAAGHFDSVKVSRSGGTLSYTWHGKVTGAFGTKSGVRAAAIAFDAEDASNAAGPYSAAESSAASQQFRVDGDRPTSPSKFVTPTNGLTGGATTSYTFPTAGSTPVVGVGDTLRLRVKLGGAATSVLTTTSTLKVKADLFGKDFTIVSTPSAAALDTLSLTHIIKAGDYGDVVGADNATATDTFQVFVVDAAGNRSDFSGSDTASPPQGVTAAVNFFVDAKLPVLDGAVAAGDTVLPVSNDTITDGTINANVLDDLNPIKYNLGEALSSLKIAFGSGGSLTLPNSATSSTDQVLGKGTSAGTVTVHFSGGASASLKSGITSTVSYKTSSGSTSADTVTIAGSTTSGVITTGLQSVAFTPTDLAGNVGPVLTRTNVYVDVDDLTFVKLFPTTDTALDTIEESTAVVSFTLSEVADSVLITYTPISGNGTSTRSRALVGSELTTSLEQEIGLDSLVSNTQYTLRLRGADLAGNYVDTTAGTFIYDTTFVVPVIAQFNIVSDDYHPAAGDTVTMTIQAQTADEADAVTYKKAASLFLDNIGTATVWGTGVTAGATEGRYELDADGWTTGARDVKIRDTLVGDGAISATVIDSSDTTNIFTGTSDSTIVAVPAALDQIFLSAADTVGQGDNFWVTVSLADKFGNTRDDDGGFVEFSTGTIGVQLPNNALLLEDGVGGFWANSSGYSGSLTITARGISDEANAETGSLSIYVSGDGATVIDAPDTLVAEDYKGALGAGDQGGFVLLTFPASDDHSTLSGYRIYREVAVNVVSDGAGGLADLETAEATMIPWGHVDAVPGQDVVRVVVATLDGDLTAYGVAAERGGLTSKEAFDGSDAVSTPYELMAETMVKSKEVAAMDLTAPIFATLTPEALAFNAEGVAPRLKSVDGVLLSSIRESEAVRAIDNIAPAPVSFMQASDTQADAGGSITVQWAKSADDKLLTTTIANAVGATSYTTAGVEGYNIYRKIGDAAWQLVGQTGAGETSFEDATVFNGVRYNYRVEARDADNITTSEFEKSAMAIRNNVVDADGNRILGLFGADARVDYDDFFIFADHFGLTAGAETFDKAFDLSPNNAVDFDDFFVFADNFGREMVGIGKVVPTMAGLNSDARFYLDAGTELPRVGEEISVAVSLEDYIEVRGYGLTVEYDSDLLEFVESRVVDNILGEQDLATPQVFAQGEGQVAIAALGNTASDGELGLNLVFRAKQEIENSYIELTNGALQDGSYGLNKINSTVSVRIETRPEFYALHENYPNPFNPETTIKYQLPEAGDVRLEVYNMLGQVVKTLVDNQFQNAGRHTIQWDATNNSGQPLSSGVYFYRVIAGGEFSDHKKMLLLK